MAGIMANIAEDDDSRAVVSQQRKRQILESDPENFSGVPKEIKCNPMALAMKKCKKSDIEKLLCSIPPLLPLQPTAPTQVPPNVQPTKPRPVPRFRDHPAPQSTSESQPQSLLATSNPSNPSGIPDEDDPMQEGHHESENEEGFSQQGSDYKDQNSSGGFFTFHEFL